MHQDERVQLAAAEEEEEEAACCDQLQVAATWLRCSRRSSKLLPSRPNRPRPFRALSMHSSNSSSFNRSSHCIPTTPALAPPPLIPSPTGATPMATRRTVMMMTKWTAMCARPSFLLSDSPWSSVRALSRCETRRPSDPCLHNRSCCSTASPPLHRISSPSNRPRHSRQAPRRPHRCNLWAHSPTFFLLLLRLLPSCRAAALLRLLSAAAAAAVPSQQAASRGSGSDEAL